MAENSWDERYRRGEQRDAAPAPLVVSAVAGVPPGIALDLACGPGRHALFLARLGWRVTAVDRSPVAIEILQQRARELNLPMDARVAALEAGEFVLEADAFDLICDINYLQRDLFPRIRDSVRPGGLVAAMIQMADDSPGIPPMNPEFLIEPDELRAFFTGWRILHESEGRSGPQRRKVAELVAQKPVASR